MNTLFPALSHRADLLEELAALLRPLLFCAADGVSAAGSSVSLNIYPATPAGERPFLDVVLESMVAPPGTGSETPPPLSGLQSLAIEVLPHALSRLQPRESVQARRLLAGILASPDCGDTEKEEAAAALGQLNRPCPSPRLLTSLRFLVGVQTPDYRQVRSAALDSTGFASLARVPTNANCWIRLRHGRDLALEIGERVRAAEFTAGRRLTILSETADWELDLRPMPSSNRRWNVEVALTTAPELSFPPHGFAVVATPEAGTGGWHVAGLGEDGVGALADLGEGRYRLGLALAPETAATAPVATAGFSLETHLEATGRSRRLVVDTKDPALENRRCIVFAGSGTRGSRRALGEALLQRPKCPGPDEGTGAWAKAVVAAPQRPSKVKPAAKVRTLGGKAPRNQPGKSPVPARAPLTCLILL